MSDEIKQKVLGMKNDLIAWRRDFHQHPEIGLKETRSAGIIADHLKQLGLKVSTGIGVTGVVGLLKGDGPGNTLMLRADMDALPIQEDSGLAFQSINDGLMHACGHDGHMAVMMATATVLADHRKTFSGTVKFVFQPGEEGHGGARLMIEDGVMEQPKVDAAFGLHIWGFQPVGTIGVREGPIMAGADVFWVKIFGEGGHAAYPESGVDAIMISGHVITSLQTLVSREVAAQDAVVVHIGLINGGTAGNAIADEVTMRLSVRTLDAKTKQTIPDRIDRIVGGIVTAFRGRYEIDHVGGINTVNNDPAMAEIVRCAAVNSVGDQNVIAPQPTMGSEDMALFLNEVPGCYFIVGGRNEAKGISHPQHHPKFDFDEDALICGTETMVRSALAYFDSI